MRRTTTALAITLVACLTPLACGESGQDGSLTNAGEGSGGSAADDPGSGSGGSKSGSGGAGSTGSTGSTGGGSTSGGSTGGAPATVDAGEDSAVLDNRVVDYGEALRSASIKLVGDLPAMADIEAIATATSQSAAQTLYEADIDKYLADPRFATTQVQWWRDTLKTGGAPTTKGGPSFDTAAIFAASVVVAGRPYTDLFTASTGTCPTFAAATGTFTAASCTNGAPTAGLLTDPGLMSQYFSNMAFRRVRFVQETFACSKFPAEFAATPVPMGAGVYTSPWAFDSIAGGATAKINFQDTSAVICANCHTTINHIAPLFADFDVNGKYTAGTVDVQTPVTPPVTTTMTDWLPAGQSLAWRNGTTITDLPSLGAAMAADPEVATCAVSRVWDWAFSHGDIVNDFATVPPTVTAPYVQTFTSGGMNMKTLIRAVFTSDDFVRF